MLRDSLYSVLAFDVTDEKLTGVIELNPSHPIFAGHYPAQPVLPGACMLEIVKELLQEAFQQQLLLAVAPQMKFLNMIDPMINRKLQYEINLKDTGEGFLKTGCSFLAEDKVCFKMQADFRPKV